MVVNSRGLNPLDEGALLHTAERLAHGEVLYRDVATGVMPGAYYVQALLFRIFPPSLWVGRVLMALLLTAASLFVWSILHRWTSPRTALLATVGFWAWQAFHWRFPGYSGQANTLILAGLALHLRFLEERRLTRAFGASLLLGTAFVFKQNFGVFALAALAVSMFSEGLFARTAESPPRRPRDALAGRRRQILVSASGALLPFAIVAALFATSRALGPFVRSVLLVPFSPGMRAFVLPYPPLLAGLAKARAQFTTELFSYSPLLTLHQEALVRGLLDQDAVFLLARVHFWMIPLVLAGGVLAYLPRWRHRRSPGEAQVRLAVLAFAALLFLGVFPRPDYHHLVMSSPVAVLLAAFLVHDLAKGLRRPFVLIAPVAVLWLGWVALSLGTLAAWIHAPDPSFRQSVRLDLPRGGIYVTPELRSELVAAVGGLDRVAGSDPVAVLSKDAIFSFLRPQPNPLPFPLVLPGALDEAEVVRLLEDQKVPFVAFANETINHRLFSQDLPTIYRYLQERYHVAAELPVLQPSADLALLRRGSTPEESLLRVGFDPSSRPPAGTPTAEDRPPDEPQQDDLPWANLLVNLSQAVTMVATSYGQALPAHSGLVRHSGWLLRDAILESPGTGLVKTVVSYTLHLPEGPSLRFWAGLPPRVWSASSSDGMFFEVWVYDWERKLMQLVFDTHLDPAHRAEDRRWRGYLVDLHSFGERRVTISLVTTSGPRLGLRRGEGQWTGETGGWGEPTILAAPGAGPARFVAGVSLPAEARTRLASFAEPRHFLAESIRYPHDPDVEFGLGVAFAQSHRPAEAIAHLEAVLRANPSHRLAAWVLANQYAEIGEDGALEELVLERLRRDPDEFQLRWSLYESLLVQKRWADARDLLEPVVRSGVRDPGVLQNLARIHLELGKPETARDYAEQAADLRPDSAWTYVLLGDAARDSGDLDAAVAHYRRGFETDPRQWQPHFFIAYGDSLRDSGNRAYAGAVFREGSRRFPEHEGLRSRFRAMMGS